MVYLLFTTLREVLCYNFVKKNHHGPHGRQPEINLKFSAQSTNSHYFALKIVKSVVEHVTIEKRFESKVENFVFMS